MGHNFYLKSRSSQ